MRYNFSATISSIVLSFVVSSILIATGDCEIVKYDAGGKRDPFIPLIGVNHPVESKLENVTSITDIKLEGIASSAKGTPIAILNGEMVKEGDKFGDIKIKKITTKNVTISISGIDYKKDLTEEGGADSGR